MICQKIIKTLCLVLLFTAPRVIQAQESISLEGTWQVRLDQQDIGLQQAWYQRSDFGQTVQLPGTLDDAGIGTASQLDTTNIHKAVLLMLTRKHAYVGPAWYTRKINIPTGWKQKDIQLYLERALWDTRVWIDGKEVGRGVSLSAPHVFNLSGAATPGTHTITMRIDNRKQYDISYKDMAHAYTDGTQIIWNGVIGLLQLQASAPVHIKSLQVYPDVAQRSVRLHLDLQNKLKTTQWVVLTARVYEKGGEQVAIQSKTVAANDGESVQELRLSLGSKARLWDEFNPHLYRVEVTAQVSGKPFKDQRHAQFGMRSLLAQGQSLLINNRPLFLRGTLECNIFPLTGHPPMEPDGWLKVFETAKSYGLNHLRFHSWCPPKAAFEVADSLGFYLQVELPLWSLEAGRDADTRQFLETEARRIMEAYGNHPSFCFWSLGNELQGDFDWLNGLVRRLKQRDDRHLYTSTTFTFEKGHGLQPEPADDFFITQYTKDGWVRGQGVFNDYLPDFTKDYSQAVKGVTTPLITHEIGQYSVYPRLGEIQKYTGVLDPLNFKTIRNDLRKKRMLHLADSFTLASGIFAAHLYKEEIERALKTEGISGFQLLDLHDFPGQGTALVGILDAFWDSKQLVTPQAHRMYCSEMVPLIRYPKATYTNGETFEASVEIANLSAAALQKPEIRLRIMEGTAKTWYTQTWNPQTVGMGTGNQVGQVRFPLLAIKRATQLTIEVSIQGTSYKNQWSIWVYPQSVPLEAREVHFTRSVADALTMLKEGKKVLLNPDTSNIKGVQGRFATVFWSPVHFPDQPGSMGLWCQPNHPALKHFPTSFYTDWQWWDLIRSSKTMIMDALPDQQPIVRVIDNFFKNRKMANIWEARLGKGRLMVSSVNIADQLDQRPAARQLRYSLSQYMQSDAFQPTTTISAQELETLFKW